MFHYFSVSCIINNDLTKKTIHKSYNKKKTELNWMKWKLPKSFLFFIFSIEIWQFSPYRFHAGTALNVPTFSELEYRIFQTFKNFWFWDSGWIASSLSSTVFFLVYINDLSRFMFPVESLLFADDTVTVTSKKTLLAFKLSNENALCKAPLAFTSNKLHLKLKN